MIMDSSTKQFGASKIYRGIYAFTALFFAALCAYRTALLFNSKPGIALTVLFFALAFILFLLLPRLICGKDEKTKPVLHQLVSAFFCVYGMTFYTAPERSLVWLIVFALLVFFVGYALKKESGKNVRFLAAGLGLLFAVFVFLGFQLKTYERLEILYVLAEPLTLLRMLFSFAGNTMLLIFGLNTVFAEILERDYSAPDTQKPSLKRKALKIGLLTAGIFIFYLPYFYVFFQA